MDRRDDKQNRTKGVEVYTSTNLERWQGPQPVFVIPPGFWADDMVWAPEVHCYQGKYYLFVTFTSRNTLAPVPQRPVQVQRGSQILVADSPVGPFRPFQNRAHTPADWMALDGTLWVEEGVPWMVFCHEWVQTTDGTIDYVRLKDDLSDVVGSPLTLFRATDGAWVRPFGRQGDANYGFVTDGPFLYRTITGRLLMIWSSFGEQRYAVGLAASTSGTITGPWQQIEQPLFAADGGHGMIFRTFEGQLMLSIHQPNSGAPERARFIRLKDTGELLEIE
jgi:beta-xylosidase